MTSTTATLILDLLARARAPRLRTMREFAEQEIIIPEGPYQGLRFKADRQPFAALLFDEIDSGRWSRFAILGPSQSGKTLCGSVIPCLYHLFEVGETFIYGAPDADMAADKWLQDLRPAIEASRFADHLPSRGTGSKGGFAKAMRFPGATLRFLTGGGGDKSRAGFTARGLGITEVDGMDVVAETSREADKVSQLEARTNAFGPRRRVYLECTVSTEAGRIWREYQGGTCSRIVIPCPRCARWVTPEREHLRGWEDAGDVVAARENGAIHCPECGAAWTEAERLASNARGRLVHRGQEVDADGEVHGTPPATDTLGFRWTSTNNCLVPIAEVAAKEWKAKRNPDEDAAEREMRQFFWALPYVPSVVDMTALDPDAVAKRSAPTHARGIVPEQALRVSCGVDIGKRRLHFVALAHLGDGSVHVVDYGAVPTRHAELGPEKGVLEALRDWRDNHATWTWRGNPRKSDMTWIDSQYLNDVIHAFCSESGDRYLAAQGVGTTPEHRGRYYRPRGKTAATRIIGEGYHVDRLSSPPRLLVKVDSDYWKSWVHERLATPPGKPGAMALFRALPSEHTTFARHLTAEKIVSKKVPGRGVLKVWVNETARDNHYLDAAYLASAAGHMVGARLIPEAAKPEAADAGVRVDSRAGAVQVRAPADGPPAWDVEAPRGARPEEGASAAPGVVAPVPSPIAVAPAVTLGDWFAGMKRRR